MDWREFSPLPRRKTKKGLERERVGTSQAGAGGHSNTAERPASDDGSSSDGPVPPEKYDYYPRAYPDLLPSMHIKTSPYKQLSNALFASQIEPERWSDDEESGFTSVDDFWEYLSPSQTQSVPGGGRTTRDAGRGLFEPRERADVAGGFFEGDVPHKIVAHRMAAQPEGELKVLIIELLVKWKKRADKTRPQSTWYTNTALLYLVCPTC